MDSKNKILILGYTLNANADTYLPLKDSVYERERQILSSVVHFLNDDNKVLWKNLHRQVLHKDYASLQLGTAVFNHEHFSFFIGMWVMNWFDNTFVNTHVHVSVCKSHQYRKHI